MNASSVIVRELRAESRRGANYWLRVLAAGTLILVFGSIIVGSQLRASQVGMALFAGLNQTFFYAIWVLVPLMTADCVSREKREGTLGLLFLTPLTVLDVIVGKTAIHALRALSLFLAALPVLGLPFVLGGVDWRAALVSAVGLADAALLAIAAGIYASTRGGSTIQVMVLAEACAWGLAFVSSFWVRPFLFVLPGAALRQHWFAAFVVPNICLSLAGFAWLLRASVRRLQQTWHEEAAAPEQPRWVQIWTDVFSVSPFWQSFFRWNKSRTLDRNPIAWLQEYSWTARLTKWGWFLLLLLAVILVFTDFDSRRAPSRHYLLTGALALGVAFSAVGSFRREEHTGLLELLLVTPVTERQLLSGRLWGMCGHYLPSVGILWFGWTGLRLLNSKIQNNEVMTAMFPNPVAFISLMVVGLYFSLSRLNFFLAWLLTWVAAFILPLLAIVAIGRLAGVTPPFAFGLPMAFQVVLAALAWLLLSRKIRRRTFLCSHGDKPLLV